MGEGEAREGRGIFVGLERSAEPGEIDVERGPAVELVDPVAVARSDQHRLAHGAPSVAYAQPDRRVGADGRRHHGVVHDRAVVKLEGTRHLEVVSRAPAHEGHASARHAVSAADDLLLVAGQPVAEQQEHAVWARLEPGHAARRGRAGGAQVARGVPCARRAHREARAAQAGHDDAGVPRPSGRDLARGGATHERDLARDGADPGQQRHEVVRRDAISVSFGPLWRCV